MTDERRREEQRQRLRDQITDQDDEGQRSLVRNWVIEMKVDHEALRESFEEFSMKTGSFMTTVDGALFKGDASTGAPGIVPFTNRVSTLLDAGCRFVKWTAGIIVTVATLTTPLWLPIFQDWLR